MLRVSLLKGLVADVRMAGDRMAGGHLMAETLWVVMHIDESAVTLQQYEPILFKIKAFI